MDDGTFSPNSTFGAFPDSAMDLDFMDELLFEGCWLETSSGVVNDPSHSFPYSEPNTGPLNINLHPHQQVYQGQTGSKFPENASLVYPKVEELRETHPQHHQGFETPTFHGQCGSFLVQGNESSRSLWIVPRASSSSTPVQHRLMQALSCLKDFIKDKNVLIQIWVPVKREGKDVLTTVDQPYTLNSDCKRLASYRDVSERYHFAVDADSTEFTGLPGRVFLRQLPEWTPDVRFFENTEYPRIDHAHQFDVHGSLAVPVFEQGGRTCLGVVEFVTTSQKTNYRDVENVCKALEAFDLRSSKDSTTSCAKAHGELYDAALTKIAEVLKSFCKNNNIPLALTWAPCVQESKGGCQRYEVKTPHYVLTSACFVADEKLLDFRAECSEHQLLQGQGIVGRAFAINKQCFAADITAFSRSDYPLSHHAKVFELHAAIAIPLQGLKSGLVEYVLEFFLPKECGEIENKNWILNSLSIVIQQSCQSLHLAMEKELEEVVLPIREMGVTSDASSPSKETSPEPSSWNIKEPQQRGKGFSVSWENKEQEPKEEFKITTHWDDARAESYHKQVFPEFGQFQHSGHKSIVAGGGESSPGSRRLEGTRRAGEKRRTKTEKTISLQVLRQYFAGSLKDAAKSIGVCPTTLKRICRQHGITRWPSRKIKKVGHSLRKLQLVIDSVQGAEGAIKIGSFYNSFPELSSPKLSGNVPVLSIKTIDHSTQLNPQADNALFSNGATVSKSPSSSCSQSSGSSTCCSTGAKQRTTTINASSSGEAVVGDSGGMLKRARSDAELHALNQDEPKLLARSQSHKLLGEHANLESLPPLPKGRNHNLRESGTFRVKATFGEEKIRFSLQPNWGFREIQQEIARRFSIEDISRMDLKYLDDDDEWVLLTCDADLEECIDIYKSSQSHTIKISLHGASHQKFAKVVHSTAPS